MKAWYGVWAPQELELIRRVAAANEVAETKLFANANLLYPHLQNFKGPDALKFKMVQRGQKMNIMPKMRSVGDRDTLEARLLRLAQAFGGGSAGQLGANISSFVPKTYPLPGQLNDVPANSLVILKSVNLHGGAGVQVVRHVGSVIEDFLKSRGKRMKWESWMAQEYVDPLLIDGKKFHIRLMVLVRGPSPMRVWMLPVSSYLCVATANFSAESLDPLAHITNPHVQAKNPEYFINPDTYTKPFSALEDVFGARKDLATFKRELGHIVLASLLASAPELQDGSARESNPEQRELGYFEMLGYDVLVGSDLKPRLIEVNRCPGGTKLGSSEKSKLEYFGDFFCILGLGCQRATRNATIGEIPADEVEDWRLLSQPAGMVELWRREVARTQRTEAMLLWPSPYLAPDFDALIEESTLWGPVLRSWLEELGEDKLIRRTSDRAEL